MTNDPPLYLHPKVSVVSPSRPNVSVVACLEHNKVAAAEVFIFLFHGKSLAFTSVVLKPEGPSLVNPGANELFVGGAVTRHSRLFRAVIHKFDRKL